MKSVLILCTGNSCRSVMAEALVNSLAAKQYKAVSAGSNPVGYVHPKALETLELHGIALHNPRSKSWNEFTDKPFHTVITVCDQAERESCPIFLGDYQKLHWSIPDPAKAEGSQKDINQAFDEAFQMLKNHIEKELL